MAMNRAHGSPQKMIRSSGPLDTLDTLETLDQVSG